MTAAQIARQVVALPQDSQRLVLDMIAALKPETTPSKPARTVRKPKWTPLHKERFVGMWRDRADLASGRLKAVPGPEVIQRIRNRNRSR